jgi:hypothetical protein
MFAYLLVALPAKYTSQQLLTHPHLSLCCQVAATISRGLMKRSFLAWQRLAQERWWKNQLVMREREVALLEGKIRGFEKRPIQVRVCVCARCFCCCMFDAL